VNVSSRGAFRGEPDHPAYAASKAGLNAFGQSMAVALAPQGVVVGTVAPGFVETDMANAVLDGPDADAIRAQSPFGRVARPEEVASAVRWLAAPGIQGVDGTTEQPVALRTILSWPASRSRDTDAGGAYTRSSLLR